MCVSICILRGINYILPLYSTRPVLVNWRGIARIYIRLTELHDYTRVLVYMFPSSFLNVPPIFPGDYISPPPPHTHTYTHTPVAVAQSQVHRIQEGVTRSDAGNITPTVLLLKSQHIIEIEIRINSILDRKNYSFSFLGKEFLIYDSA
jgi:hypothetical protein